jgi:vacuolar-type H+-ATPase subunit F/Vma7
MARLVIVTTPELAPGFELSGASTVASRSAEEACRAIHELARDPETGVIGVHEPYLEALDPGLREKLERSLAPLVVVLPAGVSGPAEPRGPASLAELMRRAIGTRITFRPRGG